MKWIRPIISLVATGGVTAGFFLGLIPPEAYIGLATAAIVWWFKSRDETKAKGE